MTSRFLPLHGMAPPPRRHASLALLGLMLLTLSACGGGGGGAAPAGPVPPDPVVPTDPPENPGGNGGNGGGGGGGGGVPSGPPQSGFVPTATLSQSGTRTLQLQDGSTNAGGQVSQSTRYTLINEGVTP